MTEDDRTPPPPPEPGSNPWPMYGAPPPGHGTPPPPYGVPAAATPGSATTSLVLGIVSLTCCLGLLTGIPAIIFGRKATKEIDGSGGAIGGRGLATAGFVLGIVGTVLSAVAVSLLALGAISGDTFEGTCTITVNGETRPC